MLNRLLKNLCVLAVNFLNLLLGGSLPPFVCVCVIVEEQGRFLVVESARERFAFPGGFVRWHEGPAQAARREGKEETGLLLRVNDVIGYYSSPATRFRSTSTLNIVFSAEVVCGVLRGSHEGRPRWLDESELRAKMEPLSRRMLDDYHHHQCVALTVLETVGPEHH